MEQEKSERHSPMQILAAASKASGHTMEEMLGQSRKESIVEARCAFIAMALKNGYTICTAMDTIDRERTVCYNYKHKLEGHLSKSERFAALLLETAKRLEQVKPRAEKPETPEPEPMRAKPMPMPKPHRSPLGFEFSGWDVYRMEWHCKAAQAFMSRYGRASNKRHR